MTGGGRQPRRADVPIDHRANLSGDVPIGHPVTRYFERLNSRFEAERWYMSVYWVLP